jgi:peptidoglycan/LPS O-acetylase OafA/YrhL
LPYRRDIDGLRALAVAAIVVFHLDEKLLPGGFLGVDLFFVISGFLITGLVAPEMKEDRFSFTVFFWRRAKRILPALYLVIAATLVAGAFALLPEDFAKLASSARYSLLSLANFYFYRHVETGYFAEATAELPLLHLWSLGVEEQFYLVWPLALLLLLRHGSRSATLVCLLALALSFLAAELVRHRYASLAFYMMPFRAGELLAGALLALNSAAIARWMARPWVSEAAGLAGLILVCGSIAVCQPAWGFPGLKAVPLTLGAAMIIASGARGNTIVARLLSLSPLVGLGAISYSTYLWHWPILAFLAYYSVEVSIGLGLAVVAATLALATLTYFAVERPFRASKGDAATGLVRLVAMPVAAGVGLTYVASHLALNGYLLAPAEAARVAAARQLVAHPMSHNFNCQVSRFDPDLLSDGRCVIGAPGAETLLLWGDSNAAHYVGLVDEMGKAAGFTARNLSHNTCPPLLANGGRFAQHASAASCSAFNAAVVKRIADYPDMAVILGGGWPVYDRMPGFRAELERTVKGLVEQGRRVVLLGKVPTFPGYNRDCEARKVKVADLDCLRLARSRDKLPDINGFLMTLARETANVSYFAVREHICADGTCVAYLDGKPLYFDSGHLSIDGSRRLGRALREAGRIPAAFEALAVAPRAAVQSGK